MPWFHHLLLHWHLLTKRHFIISITMRVFSCWFSLLASSIPLLSRSSDFICIHHLLIFKSLVNTTWQGVNLIEHFWLEENFDVRPPLPQSTTLFLPIFGKKYAKTSFCKDHFWILFNWCKISSKLTLVELKGGKTFYP